LFEPRDGSLVFGNVLPVVLVKMQDIEKRGYQRLKILFARW